MNSHLLEYNNRIYQAIRVKRWHETGLTGEGVNVAVIGYGACISNHKPYITNMPNVLNGSYHDGDEIIHEVAPRARIYGLNYLDSNRWKFEECLKWCSDNQIDVICTSIRKISWNDEEKRLSKNLWDAGCIMIDSSDNTGDTKIAYPASDPHWFAIGAFSELNNDRHGYSSYGDRLDCVMYTGLAVQRAYKEWIPITHTSGATQPVAGMAALLKQIGITPAEFKDYIRDNSIRLKSLDWEPHTGWGLFILGETLQKPKEGGVVEPMPKTKPRATISPGHGGSDSGALGPTGLKEKDVVLDISLRMKPILEPYMDLKYIRTTDTNIDLYDRPKAANDFDSDIFIEAHCNGFTTPVAQGMETYHSKNGEWGSIHHNKAQRLAKITHDRVVKAACFSDRGIKTLLVTRQDSPVYGIDYYAAIRRANCPTILPEWGFITNPGDEAKLKDPAIRQLIAEETAKGILEYFGLEKSLVRTVEADVAPFFVNIGPGDRTVIEARVLIERVLGGSIYALGKEGFSSRVGNTDFHVFFGKQAIVVENTITKEKSTITADIAPFTVKINGGGRTMIEVRTIAEKVLGGRITKVDQQNGFFTFEVGKKHVTMHWNEIQIYVKEMN